ncbi:uncharacterized protein A4U43_C02F3090 [Asparagus officinalis]|uniref:Histone-lysine N-methyltransferase n=1 Tax=Asparagus officinalis TaxID=4686 RepID=A0A5P1FJI8_ASPOF|nr:histone-lysine N-methyltransferase family member SUVH9-like [Asparagus officinalis]XP_020252735.1 histone-lysine N-methyltransferase family member SUVH9-like [Asparagus officinalis]XP_020252736.1 histone-lysine N-methyltransferase family member SUVH9-like [Asparagus officinalis]XP_020252737.1 histone-lysine N-methyltransferase family member SUVH9-like [Asparagus officinalis]XP_020252738.1 histone-lysine N-methyltransferase family member SUVH9-like [Asparagus officinalis]XP_020252739.1 histo
MADAGLWLNRDRRTVGFIPGTRIGDVFFFRMELCVLGLHGHLQAGIDYVAAGEPIATSIVFSGGYEDDEDRGEVIFYTGHGGRQGKNARKQSVGQELKDGNLALERSCNYGIEIRVIRGLDCERSPTKRVYVYDGLYRVVECLSEIGKSGFVVFKFKLVRIEGQEVMGSSAIKLAEELKKNALGVRPNGYLSLDISQGKEKEPVAVFNDVDSNCDPLLCEYLVSPEFASFVRKPGGRGCKCQSVCSVGCVCVNRNGGEFAYDLYGRLLKGKPLVYECGRYCGCPPSCVNRVSQKGLRHQLEIFRSSEGRWAVRSLDIILAGEFVCEFSGSLFAMEQLELEARNGLILVDPNRLPRRWEEWGDLSMVKSDYEKPKFPSLPYVGYFIDVLRARNVACYMSHRSSPNCFVQFVLVDHYNVAYPRLMIFAMENIPPMRELSLDYGFGDV